jgi:hypothetical protein
LQKMPGDFPERIRCSAAQDAIDQKENARILFSACWSSFADSDETDSEYVIRGPEAIIGSAAP